MPEKRQKYSKAPASERKGDGGAAEVAERLHGEQERGYQGSVPDETPNHAYTVAGVTAHEGTPETDEGLEEQPATNESTGND